MDFNSESPFSFDLGDDLLPLPSLSFTDNITHVPHLPPTNIIISPFDDNNINTLSQNPKNGRPRNPPSADDIDDEPPNEHKKKKIIHRDVERQRRQEMSSLYATLRSLLPIEYLKGKRSICDHMQETVKYIQHMQSKIQQLSNKRDKLKKLSSENSISGMVLETLNSSKRDSVVVRPRYGSEGVRVVLDTATQHRLPVSNILQVVTVEGLEIISCISTQINDRFLHTIEFQPIVSSGRSQNINVFKLQHKLTNLEYFPLD